MARIKQASAEQCLRLLFKGCQLKSIAGGALIPLMGISAMQPVFAAQDFQVRTISSRPDVVSGGDVLVQLETHRAAGWAVEIEGRNVTSSFHPTEHAGVWRALLGGLERGSNQLMVKENGVILSKIQIVNHPLAGPIFSGPHQMPFICETEANGLGPAQDVDCSAKTIVQYYYKSKTDLEKLSESSSTQLLSVTSSGLLGLGFKPHDPTAPMPSDMAQTVTADGRTVPYIVRREIGVINRAVYDIQFLHIPGEALPDPWTHSNPGWNGRLVYLFGGGCGTGHHQGVLWSVGPWQENYLSQGYAVATSTLNFYDTTCSSNISAEALSMVKEHFIKEFGVPIHTIGIGGSGGAIQVQMIAQNYPGLLDGIIPQGSFPDEATNSSDAGGTFDCMLLDHAFRDSKEHWTEVQRTAVSGFATWHTCANAWGAFNLPILDSRGCDPAVPAGLIYDPISNPKGVRCNIYDNDINVAGRDPKTGFARRTLDNVGVQYGLAAFNRGLISAEQFIDLNTRIGGFDADGQFVSTRSQADPETVRMAFQRGLVLSAGGGLGDVPIIDSRSYSDDLADVHDLVRSYVTRARLVAARGNADNQVILVGPRIEIFPRMFPALAAVSMTADKQLQLELVRQMDHWLDNIARDESTGQQASKIARNRPAVLADGCWTIDGKRIVEHATYDGSGVCSQLYPPHGDPRLAAGEPLTEDIVKCELKPIRASDYAAALSDDQLRRLKEIFPSGVCDYSKPGIGQTRNISTWQRFGSESQGQGHP